MFHSLGLLPGVQLRAEHTLGAATAHLGCAFGGVYVAPGTLSQMFLL